MAAAPQAHIAVSLRCEHGDLLLRPLAADDARRLCAAVRASADSLGQWLEWCHPDYGLADAQAFIAHSAGARADGSGFAFGVFDRRSGELLGSAGLSGVDHGQRCANLGYWIGEPHRGHGVATQAAGMVARIAFGPLGLRRLEIVVRPDNHASVRVAQKLGATCEGLVPGRLRHRGEPADALLYALRAGAVAASDAGSAAGDDDTGCGAA